MSDQVTARDDTAYVQGFIDRGEQIPAGTWACPEGLTVPADYAGRARAAGREPDAPGGSFLLGDKARFTFAGGSWMSPGYVLPGGEAGAPPVILGRDGVAMTVPHQEPLGIGAGWLWKPAS